MLTHHVIDKGELIGKDNSGGSIGRDDVYIGRVKEIVLVSLSILYSDIDRISVNDSRVSSCPAYTIYWLLFKLKEKYMILV